MIENVDPEEVHDTVLLIEGWPRRVDRITTHCESVGTIADKYEIKAVNATYEGVPLTVSSAGMGTPFSARVVETFSEFGSETLVRIGTVGALRPSVGRRLRRTDRCRQGRRNDERIRTSPVPCRTQSRRRQRPR